MASFLDSILGSSGVPSNPTSQLISTSSISPWAQPYVSSYLQRAQNLSTQGPSAFQNQVASSAQNMGMPEQFGQGSNLLNQAGQGQLGTVNSAMGYGSLGSGYGGLGAAYGLNAGANYAAQATNPNSVGAYMNPYLQQSLAPQLGLLNQQQALGSQDIAAKATGQGAFGGNRATLAQGLNNQNYALAKQQAIGQGYNEAFKNAQQAQQFGSTLGLQGATQGAGLGIQGAQSGLAGVQGAQQGYSGATQSGVGLGNIGAQQGQYDLAKMALQNQIANQQYKQPFENVQFMQSMMGGLPVSASTQQGYQAPPNYLSQLTGLGLTGLGVYGMGKDNGWWKGLGGGGGGGGITYGNDGYTTSAGNFINPDDYSMGMAKGGEVQGYAKGGTVNYSTGGDINLVPTDKLAPMMQSTNITPMDAALIQQELVERARMKSNPQTPQIMGGGLDTIPSGEMFKAAGGGIVAFAEGDVVNTKTSYSTPKPMRSEIKDYQSLLESQIRAAMEDQGSPYSKSQALEQEYLNAMKERQAKRPAEALIGLGAGIMSGESPYALSNIGKGGIGALQQMQKYGAEDAADRKLLLQQQVEQEKSADARKTARLNAMQNQLGQMYTREIGLKNAGATAQSAAASKAATEYNKNWNNFQHAIALEKNNLMNQKSKTFDYEQNPSKLDADAYTNVYNKMPPSILSDLKLPDPKAYQARAEGVPEVAIPAAKPGAVTPTPVPAAKTQYLPMPASAAEAVPGKIYNTVKGPAKWDGKQFIPL